MVPPANTPSNRIILIVASSAAALFLIYVYTKVSETDKAISDDDDGVSGTEDGGQSSSDPASLPQTGRAGGGESGAGMPSNPSEICPLPPHLEREAMKERRRHEKRKDLSMKSPMYDNVKMTDRQGELLCSISSKKGRWYVSKGLADWTTPDHTCIKLRFEPKARSNDGEEGRYNKADKSNICVKCGDAEYHMRHYIVPYAYRTLLPLRYKTHLSHDIVILCPKCHVHCERRSQLRMKEMEDDLRPPGSASQFDVDRELYEVRSCALALLRWKHKLPESKIAECDRIVRVHLNLTDEEEELSEKELQEAIDVEYRTSNPSYVPGPELVVRSLNGDGDKIEAFVKGWRRHFLDAVRPRFLPTGWSIDSPVVSGPD